MKLDTNFILFLYFLSAVQFVPFLSAEMQPIAAFVALPIILRYGYRFAFSNDITAMSFLILFFAVGFVITAAAEKDFNFIAFLSYIIGPITLCCFALFSHRIKLRTVKFLLFLFVFISIIQTITPSGIAEAINPILDNVISRMQLGGGFGVRGVDLIYSEPSHAARFIWLLAILLVAKSFSPYKTKLLNAYVVFALVWLFISNRSATLAGLGLLTVGFYYTPLLLSAKRALTLKTFCSVVIVILSLSVVYALDLPRLTQVLNAAITLVSQDFSFTTLQYFGSIRFLSVASGYIMISEYPWGVGLGRGGAYTIITLSDIGVNISGIHFIANVVGSDGFLKPGSYVSQVIADFGIFGIFGMVSYTSYLLYVFRPRNSKPFLYAVFWCSLFQLYFFSTTTMPPPWIGLGLAIGWGRSGLGLKAPK